MICSIVLVWSEPNQRERARACNRTRVTKSEIKCFKCCRYQSYLWKLYRCSLSPTYVGCSLLDYGCCRRIGLSKRSVFLTVHSFLFAHTARWVRHALLPHLSKSASSRNVISPYLIYNTAAVIGLWAVSGISASKLGCLHEQLRADTACFIISRAEWVVTNQSSHSIYIRKFLRSI